MFAIIKNIKTLAVVGVVGSILIGSTLYLHNLKKDSYERGFDDAVSEYTQRLVEVHNSYNKEIESKLKELRLSLQEQHSKELERVKSEVVIDTKVETVKEYIEKEIYVKAECNTVPPNLNRMFNEAIRSINSGKGQQ